ncbi:hypothetical protein D0T84_15445 [Dysgonomonas sp. 521]|uniref:hypothetical protein n=1 Tax=Dysgonomonas sp. 521 TaxID=2302932 RepID=UPI0013D325A5|nr:hypothetical protein [Dysgonomonas sp. 521]NDV96296.1 hypothetical protein [Dysgonomonas sp. 521]
MGLGKNIAGSEKALMHKEKYKYIFSEEYFKDRTTVGLNPDYNLVIENYNHSYKVSTNYGYHIDCQNILLQDKSSDTLFSTRFTFGKLFYHYLLHSNNNEYLVCGYDLLEFAVYDITNKTEHQFFDICNLDEDSEEDCQNEFWYIKKLFYNAENNLLAITGQDGMNVSTVTVCDFSNPDDFFSYRATNLGKYINDTYGDYCCSAHGWAGNKLQLSVCEENSMYIDLDESEIISLINMRIKG